MSDARPVEEVRGAATVLRRRVVLACSAGGRRLIGVPSAIDAGAPAGRPGPHRVPWMLRRRSCSARDAMPAGDVPRYRRGAGCSQALQATDTWPTQTGDDPHPLGGHRAVSGPRDAGRAAAAVTLARGRGPARAAPPRSSSSMNAVRRPLVRPAQRERGRRRRRRSRRRRRRAARGRRCRARAAGRPTMHRHAGGEVLVDLQRAHRLGERRAPVGEQAEVGVAQRRDELGARDARVHVHVRERAEVGDVGGVGQRAEQHDLERRGARARGRRCPARRAGESSVPT